MKVILILVWLHFVADFILQTDKMALNKSKSNKWLAIHVFFYSIPFLLIGLKYAIVNGALHFVTDWVTSRLSARAWKNEKRALFFKIIGCDQTIHMTCLIVTSQFPALLSWWLT